MPIRTRMHVSPPRGREAVLEELRRSIQRGIEQADRGERLEGDALFEEIRQLTVRRRSVDR